MTERYVSPEQYPELETFILTSEREQGRFTGKIIEQGLPCDDCGTSDTVTVYRGPQYGLAFDVPINPYEEAPIDMELTWCTQHGTVDMRLVDGEGNEHTGL